MSRLDNGHNQVVRALEKENWNVEDTSLKIETDDRSIIIDIEASRNTNGSRQRLMLAEVKCFAEPRKATSDLYSAIGQYIVYRAVLNQTGMNIPLYLAIPDRAQQSIFDMYVQYAVQDSKIKLLIVNLEMEAIVKWIE